MEKHKVGYCPGSFDMFHRGHLNLLKNSASRCEYLIAGVVTDEVYMSYKHRPPVIPFEDRLEIVAQCKYVDEAIGVTMELQNKWKAWEKLHYDCHFAGSDHQGAWPALEKQLNEVGAYLEFFPYTESVSSTQLKKTLQRDFSFKQCMGEVSEPVLVLFGAGAKADAYISKFGANLRPAFLVDSNSAKWGSERSGVMVKSPECLKEIEEDKLHVVICSKYVSQIAKQLVDMGIRDYRIFEG